MLVMVIGVIVGSRLLVGHKQQGSGELKVDRLVGPGH